MTQDPTTSPSSSALSRRGFLLTSGAAGALGVAVVAVAVGPDAAPRWFPLVLATCVIATFV
ncbi:hypothetical protein DZG03_16950, partial [Clavibacter phaseoli]